MFEIYPEMSSSDAKAERGFLRKVIAFLGAVCFFLLFALAATWPTKANAAPLFKNIGNDGRPVSLRLLDTPCTHPKVKAHLEANVKDEFIPKFKSAVLHYGGKDWASCWIEYQGFVLSYDEEGAPFAPPTGIPLEMFKEDSV